MKQFIQITLNTGHVYEIPTSVIANDRAQSMLLAHPEEFADIDAALEDTTGLFADDSFNIQDWAANNMNWEELLPQAKLVRFKPPVSQPWHEGEFSFHDAPALMGELDGETIMKQPVELIMHTMAMQGQLCNATVLHGADGKPYGAFVMIIGNRPVINTYLNGLQFVGDMLTKQAGAEPADEAAPAAVTH
jgi:hypothetical protein